MVDATRAASGAVSAHDAEARLNEMTHVATMAMGQAYAPYSHFRVGAALLTRTGAIVPGCNVENASYPAGICAERGAVMAAVAGGMREFDLIVVTTEATEPTPPCGICRQVLAEFAPGLPVVSVTANGRIHRWTLNELLPSPFLPASLGERRGPGPLTDDR